MGGGGEFWEGGEVRGRVGGGGQGGCDLRIKVIGKIHTKKKLAGGGGGRGGGGGGSGW